MSELAVIKLGTFAAVNFFFFQSHWRVVVLRLGDGHAVHSSDDPSCTLETTVLRATPIRLRAR